jgi:hypothetical protein
MSKTMVRSRPRTAEALHQLVLHHGVEACTDLVAAATPAQVTALLDLDLWRPVAPGEDARFDADRFAEWLEALVDADPTVAARVVAGLDVSLVAAGLAGQMRVFDLAAGAGLAPPGCVESEVGGYLLRGRTADRWDAIVLLLAELEASHPAAFHAVMRAVRRLSSSTPEIDGLDARLGGTGQALHDLALAREDRRARQGYLAPADARAFLQLARACGREAATRTQPNPIAAQYVREAGAGSPEVQLAFLTNALVAGCSLKTRAFTPAEAAEAVNATCRLGREVQTAPASVPAAFVRPVRSDARLAVRDATAARLELVDAFEIGWAVLHADVSMTVARRLIDLFASLRVADTATDQALLALRHELAAQVRAGTPWRAGDAFDIVATLDTPCWMAILGILDECPTVPEVLHAIVERRTGAISATAFAFVDSQRTIATIHAFVDRLPALLAS